MQIRKDRIHHDCPNDVHVCVVIITAYYVENYHDDMVNFCARSHSGHNDRGDKVGNGVERTHDPYLIRIHSSKYIVWYKSWPASG